jgi:histidyl-tRNA synthetase
MPRPKYTRPKGTTDILPEDQIYWDAIRETLKKVSYYYNFQRIDTPMIEDTDLFVKSIGASSDIVEKEMFSFKTKGGDKLTLRTEGTAPVVRAYIENGMKNRQHPVKLFYIGPMLRHENPQHNRQRQFHQFGFEVIGSKAPIIDAQLIQMAFIIFKELKISDLTVHINSIGCQDCRPDYLKDLKSYLKQQINKLPAQYRKKVRANPLRIFDIKDERCQQIAHEAPQIIDALCDDCREDFERLLEFLDFLEIPYVFSPFLVRGLDYYNGAVYEILPNNKEYANKEALGGGGRYDYLIKAMGGNDIPATGAAFGIERLINYMKATNIIPAKPEKEKIFIAHLGDFGQKRALKLMEELRDKGFNIREAFSKHKLNPQKKIARREKSDLLIMVTQKEALEDCVIVKDDLSGTQEIVEIKKLPQHLKDALKRQKTLRKKAQTERKKKKIQPKHSKKRKKK